MKSEEKDKLFYLKSKIDKNNLMLDIPSDELYALSDVSAIYIYCSEDLKKYYIGQTNSIIRRHLEHSKEKEEESEDLIYSDFKDGTLIIFYSENTSSNLNYVENSLIKLFKSWEVMFKSSYGLELLNKPSGNRSDLLQIRRETVDVKVVKEILDILNKERLILFPIDEKLGALKSILFRHSPFYELTEGQQRILNEFIISDNDFFVIRGGAGTGKTVLLNHIVAQFLGDNIKNREKSIPVKKIAVCLKVNIKNQIKGIFQCYRKNLEYYGIYINTFNNLISGSDGNYDYLLVDEAHRLIRKGKGLFPVQYRKILEEGNKDTALELLLDKSNKTLLFYDEYQRIRPSDMENIGKKADYAAKLGLDPQKVYEKKLNSQYRIKIKADYKKFNISYANNYVKYIKYMLGLSKDKPSNLEFLDYDYFGLCNSIDELKDYIDDKRKKFPFKKASILAGQSRLHDKGRKGKQKGELAWKEINMGWNSNHRRWASEGNYIDEVGTIHSVQGYEFDFVAVIIGKDLEYKDNRIIANRSKYFDQKGKAGIKRSENEVLGEFIKNIYYTLLTRGVYGTRVYIEDDALREYWRMKTRELKQDS